MPPLFRVNKRFGPTAETGAMRILPPGEHETRTFRHDGNMGEHKVRPYWTTANRPRWVRPAGVVTW